MRILWTLLIVLVIGLTAKAAGPSYNNFDQGSFESNNFNLSLNRNYPSNTMAVVFPTNSARYTVIANPFTAPITNSSDLSVQITNTYGARALYILDVSAQVAGSGSHAPGFVCSNMTSGVYGHWRFVDGFGAGISGHGEICVPASPGDVLHFWIFSDTELVSVEGNFAILQ